MNNIKYRVGIIGCGIIFDKHIDAIKNNIENFELVAICDIDPKKVEIRSKEYGVKGFENYIEMLSAMQGEMNLVVITTPNSFHYQMAIDSLKCGYDILVEKPIDFLSSRAAEIVDLAKKLDRKAYAVLQVRYNPTVKIVKNAIDNNFIGDIRSVSLIQRWQRPSSYFDSWRADEKIGGRTLYEVGIHYLDIVQILFGVPEVKATATFNNKHKNVKFEDTIFSILKFKNGASGSLEVTIASEPQNLECSLSIMGSDGYIKIGGKALDKIDRAMFGNIEYEKKWEEMTKEMDASIEPNSYGTHQGSCPNHPTLYREISNGNGITLDNAINSILFIEEVYNKEVTNEKIEIEKTSIIHETACVNKNCKIGENTKVWNNSQIREGAVIGKNCIIGKNVYIDSNVVIGDCVKIQNNCSLYHGLKIGDGVFIGPHVIFTNDKIPRAINADGSLKTDNDWTLGHTEVGYGASIGAGSVILPDIKIGKFAMIGSGSVVTKDVPDFTLVYGNPAKVSGLINEAGEIIKIL